MRCLRTQEHIDLKPYLDKSTELNSILADYLSPKSVRREFGGALSMVQIGG
jgi:hypothetical protein